PGALVEVLSVFDRAGINLTHIDKRPSGRTNWSYTFFIDAMGHRAEEKVAAAIDEAKSHCQSLRVLGSYPRAARIVEHSTFRPLCSRRRRAYSQPAAKAFWKHRKSKKSSPPLSSQSAAGSPAANWDCKHRKSKKSRAPELSQSG